MSIHNDSPAPTRTIGSLFLTTLWRVLVVWLLATALVGAAEVYLGSGLRTETLLIAVASGLISILALVPGIVSRQEPQSDSGRTYVLVIGCVAAMAIRVTGTVALLVACRYQLGLPLHSIGMFVCGWYVLLTFVEIASLARGASALGSRDAASTCGTIDQTRVLAGQRTENL